jgi:hypothetical protein
MHRCARHPEFLTTDAVRVAVRSKILDLYGSLSTIVHASQAQVSVDLQRWTTGTPIGFEGVAQINRLNALCLDVFDLGAVLSLHSIGLGLAGDIYTAALDDMRKWSFHNTPFAKALSAHFDYKAERQNR